MSTPRLRPFLRGQRFDECPGPAGLWPCVHPDGFGHGGDHVASSMESVNESLAELAGMASRLRAERDELRRLLLIARRLLGDVRMARGYTFRSFILGKIDKATKEVAG